MIYVECNADYALVKSITSVSKKDIVHGHNKPGVCNYLRKQSNCIGLVDEDPSSTQPPYLQKMELVDDHSEYDLKLLYHGASKNYLVLLCPKLEDWVLKAAREAKIDVRKYGLTNDAATLHRDINISLDKFEKLLEDIKNLSSRLKTLKRLIERP